MDRTCVICEHTTDDGVGKCRFCGTPFSTQTGADLELEPTELPLPAPYIEEE